MKKTTGLTALALRIKSGEVSINDCIYFKSVMKSKNQPTCLNPVYFELGGFHSRSLKSN